MKRKFNVQQPTSDDGKIGLQLTYRSITSLFPSDMIENLYLKYISRMAHTRKNRQGLEGFKFPAPGGDHVQVAALAGVI